MSFKADLENLRKLQNDIEKQMLQFDEIIPYERQTTSRIYSPRLVNMLLATGPQIEAISDLIAKKLNVKPVGKGILGIIKGINKKGILSSFKIESIHGLQFTPFELKREWWNLYNSMKHDIAKEQFNIQYSMVMDALAALAGLHLLADTVKSHQRDLDMILDPQYWMTDHPLIYWSQFDQRRGMREGFSPWKSLLFKISSVYQYN